MVQRIMIELLLAFEVPSLHDFGSTSIGQLDRHEQFLVDVGNNLSETAVTWVLSFLARRYSSSALTRPAAGL